MENDVCSICLLGEPKFETQCGHMFHRDCWQKWVAQELKNASKVATIKCPICRNEIKETSVFKVKWMVGKITFYALLPKDEPEDCWHFIGPYPWNGPIDYGHELYQDKVRGHNFIGTENIEDCYMALYRVKTKGLCTPTYQATSNTIANPITGKVLTVIH